MGEVAIIIFLILAIILGFFALLFYGLYALFGLPIALILMVLIIFIIFNYNKL